MNRLSKEKSPYLLQHAENPVDWYPWGDEAFHAAIEANKPIFLSIGYASCHWCHVMSKESFEDPAVAELMNHAFINVKVDREELPEVDSLYMEFAGALMSSPGGWPLNMILTPDLKPFFAVTYLPKTTSRGLMGLKEFVIQIDELWNSKEKEEIISQADKIVEFFKTAIHSLKGSDVVPENQELEFSINLLFESFDPVFGGLKGQPKFPVGYQLEFLLEYGKSKGENRALYCADLTLEKMAQGGIYDHLGGGFSRYAIDQKWEIPHFEKMLYDNVILARAYLAGWLQAEKPHYRTVAEETLQYLLRDMRKGGFCSAQDADSEGKEGKFYTWTKEEIHNVLSPKIADLFCDLYHVSTEGNFQGRSVLHLNKPIPDDIQKAKKELFEKRRERVQPAIDDKIIVSHNGLAIDTLAFASQVLQNKSYLDAAIETAQFLKENLWKEGLLYRRYRDGEAKYRASLEDFAFLIKGLISLFQASQDAKWLHWTFELSTFLEKHFLSENGAFYQIDDQESLIIRKSDLFDGSEPSGNGVHCENLLRLYQLTFEKKYLELAEGILKAAKPVLELYPQGLYYHLKALHRYLNTKAVTLIISLDEEKSLENESRELLNSLSLPHLEVIWKTPGDKLLPVLLPFTEEREPVDGQTAFYICTKDRCLPPFIGIDEVEQALIAL